jgi:bifunctional enzyme CysN/CysC
MRWRFRCDCRYRTVYRQDGTRWIAGTIESGSLAGRRRDFAFSEWKYGREYARFARQRARLPGMNVAVELDTDVFAERGFWISGKDSPPKLTRVFDAEVFWHGAAPLSVGTTLRLGNRHERCRCSCPGDTLGTGCGRHVSRSIRRDCAFGIGRITVRAETPFAIDDITALPATGRFVITDESETIGLGVADTSGYPDLRHHAPHAGENIEVAPHALSGPQRNTRYGHPGAVVWLTGLSGAGKSTLAMELERRLFSAGCAVYVLDGDNLRRGLNADLGFAPTIAAKTCGEPVRSRPCLRRRD